MLSPDQRSLYTAAFAPPAGYVFDEALATTYSLDLVTLLSIPVHLALVGERAAADPLRDGIALLEALRRFAGRLTVYAQGGQLQVPAGAPHALYGLLEPVVVEAVAPRGGADRAELALREHPATAAAAKALEGAADGGRDLPCPVAIALEQVEGHALRRLGAHAGQAAQRLDQAVE